MKLQIMSDSDEYPITIRDVRIVHEVKQEQSGNENTYVVHAQHPPIQPALEMINSMSGNGANVNTNFNANAQRQTLMESYSNLAKPIIDQTTTSDGLEGSKSTDSSNNHMVPAETGNIDAEGGGTRLKSGETIL